jgi:hypothetical protein
MLFKLNYINSINFNPTKMNQKITSKMHQTLCALSFKEYIFGSQLHGISNADSDFDYLRVISNDFYSNFKTLAIFLPNIHSWQYDDGNKQYVWMTEKQFYHNLFSGDGNMIADIVLLCNQFQGAMFLCRTYKIIKGYLGVAKRDLKLHGNNDKKKFHAIRSMFMAEKLMNNEWPTVTDIQNLHKETIHNLPSKEDLQLKEDGLRKQLNEMLFSKEIAMYPEFIETNELVNIMLNSNNLTEFKYN